MSTTTKTKVVRPRKQLDKNELKAEERDLKEKYPRIVPGTLKNASTRQNSPHYQKRTITIKCAKRGCDQTRVIATSDLHQVTMCERCTTESRLERRRDARREAAKKRAGKPKPR